MTPAARLQAVIDILGEIEGTRKPVERQLRDWGRAHRFAGSKDRAAIAARLYEILRRRSAFAWRMQGDSPRALAIAAALDEGTVEMLFGAGGHGPAGLSDAERATIAAVPGAPPPHVLGEYPPFLEDELRRAFGDALPDEMLALQARAPIDLRVNTLKAARDDVLAALPDARPAPRSPWGIRIAAGATGLERTELFQGGAFEFQDEAAQLAVLTSGAEPGMRVLDLAAGAGGKSLALAAMMENSGELAAFDIRAEALDELARRAARAGASIVHRVSAPQGLFDLVFVDAPCSGTGTWRRQPELRWRLTPERLAELIAIQDALLAQAVQHVAPGGRLVYATCSILPCENEDRIGRFLGAHAEFASDGAVFRASPLSIGTDGFFAAKLARREAIG
jgi:16S rRNA (cytosine967-C5)-methyltransferase